MFQCWWCIYRLASEAACLIGKCPLKDLVDPGRGGWRVAVGTATAAAAAAAPAAATVVVLGVQRAVGKAAVLLVLLPLLLQQVCDGVQQIVQELVGILLHVVIKQLCRGRQEPQQPEKEWREKEREVVLGNIPTGAL